MNNERLTELDPTKVYVNGYGQQWLFSGWWKLRDSGQYRFSSTELLGLFPDLREHVPAWYEPLLEKGWVKVKDRNMVANVTSEGEYAYMEPQKIEGMYMITRYLPNGVEIAQHGTFDEIRRYAHAIRAKVTP